MPYICKEPRSHQDIRSDQVYGDWTGNMASRVFTRLMRTIDGRRTPDDERRASIDHNKSHEHYVLRCAKKGKKIHIWNSHSQKTHPQGLF